MDNNKKTFSGNKANVTLLIGGILIGILLTIAFTRGGNKKTESVVTHNMIVEKIESLGNLEVVKFSIQDIMEYRKNRTWLPNAKTALVVSGEVIGCIDLTKLTAEDIYISGDTVRLQLPAPEMCHVKIDHKNSRIYNMQYGLWETTAIADEAYRAAEKHLEKQALKLDLAKQSRDNAVNLLRPILEALGFKNVYISFKSDFNRKEK